MVGSKRLRDKTTAMAHSGTAEASLPPRGTAAASVLQQPPIAASTFQQLPSEIQQHPMAASAFQQLPGQFQQPPMAASAFQQLPSEFQQPSMAARAFQQLPGDFQQPPRVAIAFQQLPAAFQQPIVAAHAIQPPPAATQPLQTTAIATGTQQQLCRVAAEIAAQPRSPLASSVVQLQGLGAEQVDQPAKFNNYSTQESRLQKLKRNKGVDDAESTLSLTARDSTAGSR
ncbi:hypothetical protein L3X38_023415 [Prunus dulcis]|uniref:Uncharacterized protein n=1 Tax=Prunus dulcis TaxID=3755 RepID=A0AAD4VXS2_PRUDU|nr:hypothetical protein L3X38_023415 [Prunus dulcis]